MTIPQQVVEAGRYVYLTLVEGWLRDHPGIVFTEGSVDDLCTRIAVCRASKGKMSDLELDTPDGNEDQPAVQKFLDRKEKPAMTIPEQSVALLPCPFCGEQPRAIRERSELFDLARIWCDNDECFGPRTTAANLEDATAQWNKRTPQPLVGVQRLDREDVARALLRHRGCEIFDDKRMWKSVRGVIALAEADAVLALPHTGQPQEGPSVKRVREILLELSDPLNYRQFTKWNPQLLAIEALTLLSTVPASPHAEEEELKMIKAQSINSSSMEPL